MSLVETLIRRLLADQKMVYFDDSPVFRTQVLDQPEAAQVLVQLLTGPTADLAARAGEMLCLFSRPGLPPVLAALPDATPEGRQLLLSAAWAIVQNSAEEDYPALLQAATPVLRELFRDRSRLDPVTLDTPIELEYVYLRICDQAYLLLRALEPGFYAEALFRYQADEERDSEIRQYSGRKDLPVG
jgi:hypothetical protein